VKPVALGTVPRILAVYVPGAATLAVDLSVPLDVDTGIFYSVGIVASGRLRSRWHLWIATSLFVIFALSDLVIGTRQVDPDTPRWVFIINRSFLACALLLLASIVHLWMNSVEAVERTSALLARQNEELRNVGTDLERRVRERSRELETASQERQEAQAALYQAQKMEAVGQLTGGVAHDFNNLLTTIGGNASLLKGSALTERNQQRLDAILRAADRGATLTRQLLAFSRRQALHPEPLDLRERTRETVEMMACSLREDMHVAVAISDDLWPVEADPAQLDLAMLNIGINARDAMPDGGVLAIDARNICLAPGEDRRNNLVGDFVALTLSDTGAGIEPEAQARVFEPFFTTKGVGKGSGLGLSQVYGFAKQSGGGVDIHSELGRGTAVTLYLPRAKRLPDQSTAKDPPPEFRPGAGRILHVEDNPAVAAVTRDLLAEIGFDAYGVEDAAAALATLDSGQRFDLVLTDVVMPGRMNGLELAYEIRRRAPELPVLLTSGYSERQAGAGQSDFVTLAKPYSAATLADALALCLASKRANTP
jgi:signal transduction histidine kinase